MLTVKKQTVLLFLCTFASSFASFDIPDVTFEILKPKGFRVSIPDVEGIKLFAFHGKLNEEMNGRESGTFSRDVLKPVNGRWTLEDKAAALNAGDVMYFWTYVDYDNGQNILGYARDDQTWTIPPTVHQGSGQFEVPEATFEVLRRGFRVSIPDVDGIKLFAFHGKLNEEMNGREGGTFSRDILKTKNGRWVFEDKVVKLKPGDVMYYWTYVDYFDGTNKLGYVNDDQMWVVPGTPPVEVTTSRPISTSTMTSTSTSTSTETTQCLPSSTVVNGQSPCAGTLLFEDHFDTKDSDKWLVENRFAEDPDYEFVLYNTDPENIKTSNGVLEIQPTLLSQRYGEDFETTRLDLRTECTGKPSSTQCFRQARSYLILPPVISGMMSTKNSFSFRYGKVEIRAKLPVGNWIYPQLQLDPRTNAYGFNYDSGSIRLAYSKGNENLAKQVLYGPVISSNPGAREALLKAANSHDSWANDFHTFSVEWYPERMDFKIDGETRSVVTPPSGGFSSYSNRYTLPGAEKWQRGTSMAPFDQEFYLTLGVGVGGYNYIDGSIDKPWRNKDPKGMLNFWLSKDQWYSTWNKQKSKLQVDYVKVWAL